MRDQSMTWAESDAAVILLELVERLRNEHAHDPETLFLKEFSIYGGEARADLAVVNSCLHGYEIKSRRDSLGRLKVQSELYSDVFEKVTLVTTNGHLGGARKIIPPWWGLIRVSGSSEGLRLVQARKPRQNPAQSPKGLASLLWREEALALLALLGLDAGLRSKPMAQLVEKLSSALPTDRLSDLVRRQLTARGDWLAAARRKRGDARSRPRASWSGSRRIPPSRKPR